FWFSAFQRRRAHAKLALPCGPGVVGDRLPVPFSLRVRRKLLARHARAGWKESQLLQPGQRQQAESRRFGFRKKEAVLFPLWACPKAARKRPASLGFKF